MDIYLFSLTDQWLKMDLKIIQVLKLDHTAFSFTTLTFGAVLMKTLFNFYYIKVQK